MPQIPNEHNLADMKQERARLVAENDVMVGRMTRDKKPLSKDESEKFEANYARAIELAQSISQAERQNAIAQHEKRGSSPTKPGYLPHEDPDNVGKRRYSFLRALKCLAEKRPVDGLEGEVSREIELRTFKSAQGFLMPSRLNPISDAERRALDTTAAAGAIQTTLSPDWIDFLRNATRVIQAGATQIEDLTGGFAIPRQSSTSIGYWVGEAGSPSGSAPMIDQIKFNPHTVGAFNDLTRRSLEMVGNKSMEEFAQKDQAQMLGRAIDLASINGSGASYIPLGICQNPAITTGRIVSLGTNGGAPTFNAMVELHTIVTRGNAADLGSLGYMGNADVEGTLATTLKTSTWPVFLLEEGKVYGRPFYSTQQLPNTNTKGSGTGLSSIIYGAWNQIVFGYWSGVDVLIDPFTGSTSGTIRIVTLQDLDIQCRHNEAFSFVFDMLSNQTQ